ncbi:hypothetical protein HN446_05120 [bacterium]|jgi:hypothetical protein|nr:hypothetical protein [bacterium]
MRLLAQYSLICFILFSVTSCVRIKKWTKKTFPQATELNDYQSQIKKYRGTVKLYEFFQTKAQFDVIWLSDDVREAYSEMHCRKHGKTGEDEGNVLKRQLERNNFYISFYVLCLRNSTIGKKKSKWSVYLDVDGKKTTVKDVEQVDLPPEYQELFGKKFNKFKTPVLVKFNISDRDGNFVLNPNSKNLKLVFNSPGLEGSIEWELDREGRVVKRSINKK